MSFKTAIKELCYTKLYKELYNQDPSNVNFKNGLAVSYTNLAIIALKQNDTAKAINYYKQAEQHWLILTIQFPAYVEFSKKLNKHEAVEMTFFGKMSFFET